MISKDVPILCRSPLYQVSTNNPQLCREATAWQSSRVLVCSSTPSESRLRRRVLEQVAYDACAADVRLVCKTIHTEPPPPPQTILSKQRPLSRERMLPIAHLASTGGVDAWSRKSSHPDPPDPELSRHGPQEQNRTRRRLRPPRLHTRSDGDLGSGSGWLIGVHDQMQVSVLCQYCMYMSVERSMGYTSAEQKVSSTHVSAVVGMLPCAAAMYNTSSDPSLG